MARSAGPLAGLDEVLDALGDGTRRQLVGLLAERPRAVGELAAALPVSRPAVSRHLRILSEAGIVRHTTHGRRHRYELDTPGLMALRTSLDELWDLALARFAAHAEKDAPATDPSAPPDATADRP